MKRPRKAFLLAAGLGTRMRPLTDALPKPALPLWGKPLITHVLDMMADWGVRDALINLHHQPSELLTLLRDYAATSRMRISLSFEPEVLGTGGALRRAAWFLDNEPFWLINTDIAAELSPTPFLKAWDHSAPIAALWLTDTAGPRTVELTPAGDVRTFRSAAPGTAGTYTFCGLHLVHPRIVKHIPDEPVASIIDAYKHAMQRGSHVAGVSAPRSFWRDLGTPAHYLEAHAATHTAARTGLPGGTLCNTGQCQTQRELAKAGIKITGFAAVARTAHLSPGATIGNSVIMDRATCSAVRLSDAIVAPDSMIASNATGLVMPAASVRSIPGLPNLTRRLYGETGDTLYSALPTRGSDRSFARLVHSGPTHSATASAILIHYGHERAENSAYAPLARFLRQKTVPVPRVLVDLPAQRLLAMEDAGPDSMESRLPGLTPTARKQLYRRVIRDVLRLHAIRPADFTRHGITLQPRFDAALYRWEHQLFIEKFLQGWLNLDGAPLNDVIIDLEAVSSRLLAAPLVPLHRDLQSSNIHIKPRTGELCIIDFQGMRLGPAVYDLASLLCDPYVMLPLDLQQDLLETYARHAPQPAMIRRLFWTGAIQRLSQALGAYGRLSATAGTARFARYIPPALEMITRALDNSGMQLPALRRVIQSASARHGT